MDAGTMYLLARFMWFIIIPGSIGFLLYDYFKHPVKLIIHQVKQGSLIIVNDKLKIGRDSQGRVEKCIMVKFKDVLPAKILNYAIPTQGVIGNLRYVIHVFSPEPNSYHPMRVDTESLTIKPFFMEARNWFVTTVRTDIMKRLQKQQISPQLMAIGGIILIMVMGMIYQKTVMEAMSDRAVDLGLAIDRGEDALNAFTGAFSNMGGGDGGQPPAG